MKKILGSALGIVLLLSSCGSNQVTTTSTAYDASGAWLAEETYSNSPATSHYAAAVISMANKPAAGDFTLILEANGTRLMYGSTITGDIYYYGSSQNLYKGKFENNSYTGTQKDSSGNIVATLKLTRP